MTYESSQDSRVSRLSTKSGIDCKDLRSSCRLKAEFRVLVETVHTTPYYYYKSIALSTEPSKVCAGGLGILTRQPESMCTHFKRHLQPDSFRGDVRVGHRRCAAGGRGRQYCCYNCSVIAGSLHFLVITINKD